MIMKKPYIFGHRGAMGYEIENTIKSFEASVKMGAGIETDVRLTKDKELICFHDKGVNDGSRYHRIRSLTYEELQAIKFEDGRIIPKFRDVLDHFKNNLDSIRFSCDIGSRKAGVKLMNMIDQYKLHDIIEITDTNPDLLFKLREKNDKVKLVHTIPYAIPKITEKNTNFEKLKAHGIETLNLKHDRAKIVNFKEVIDQGFKCYVWGVNSKVRMKRVMNLKYKGKIVDAIYSNYPDACIKIREKIVCN